MQQIIHSFSYARGGELIRIVPKSLSQIAEFRDVSSPQLYTERQPK